ncbi:hypothetical protein TrVE_jg14146 [Triparma verrucosa]|uniref:HSF-type DNA-binding domain-containing protein n=1 Tax=Triparma verrucosa TaxID=1606542 RepID=A0A9W7F5P7_9STRA|nr:hypothetical protein TrVE_jg14146 [Triparma verrucosa]
MPNSFIFHDPNTSSPRPLDITKPIPSIAIPKNGPSVRPRNSELKMSPLLGLTEAALTMQNESVADHYDGGIGGRGGYDPGYSDGLQQSSPTTSGYNSHYGLHVQSGVSHANGNRERSRSASPRPPGMSRQTSTGSNQSAGSRSGRSKSRSPRRNSGGSLTPPGAGRALSLGSVSSATKPGPKHRDLKVWALPSKGLDKTTFPAKVHEILRLEDPSVISWNAMGTSFAVRNRDRFINEVLPLYFRHNNITSFFRQLNLYNFQRSLKGIDVGSYQHDLFLMDRPELIKLMKRTKTKGTLSPRGDGSSRNSPFGGRSPTGGLTPPSAAAHYTQMYQQANQQMDMTIPTQPFVVRSSGMNPNMMASLDPEVVEKRLEQIDTVVNMVGRGSMVAVPTKENYSINSTTVNMPHSKAPAIQPAAVPPAVLNRHATV